MKYNILAKFNKDNKTYIYYLKDNTIHFGILENNVILEVSETEYNMMINLMSQIFISPNIVNHIDMGFLTYKNKKYKIFFDKISKLTYFLEIVGNNLIKPNPFEIANLIYLYNDNFIANIRLEFNSKKSQKSKTFFKKIVFIGVSTIVVFISINTFKIYKVVNQKNYCELSPQKNLSYEELYETLNSNNDIGEFEKLAFINSSKNFMSEIGPYINNRLSKERLSTLKIKYLENNINIEEPLSTYSALDNLIKINLKNINGELFRNIFFHEIIHVLTPPISIGNGIDEGLTEILADEYFKNTTEEFAYSSMCNIDKALFEIIGTEPFLKFKFEGNEKYLIDALCKIIPDKNKAYELISYIDTFYNGTYHDNNISVDDIKIKIYEHIKDYYLAQYNKPIQEDLLIMTYLKNAGLIDKEVYYNLDGLDYPIIDIYKPYFSKSLKINNSNGYFLIGTINYPLNEFTINMNLPYNEAMEIISLYTKNKGLCKIYTKRNFNDNGDFIIEEAHIKWIEQVISINEKERYSESMEIENTLSV